MDNDFEEMPEISAASKDPAQERARETLVSFFEDNREGVFYSRQLAVIHEGEFFHWVTYRALMELIESRFLVSETRALNTGGEIKLVWHRRYRYPKRSASRVVELVEELSQPATGAALGQNAELLVLEGFARKEFLMKGRNAKRFEEKEWDESEHDLDLIFKKDGIGYGIEVKNTLGYIDDKEFKIKIRLCKRLGLRPVFVVRMLPKTWIKELIGEGGFGLILKYQMFPMALKSLAKNLADELRLPADSPRALAEGTMERFVNWHNKNIKKM